MKKPEKLPVLASEHKAALAILAGRPEFKAYEKLMRIEENNIIIQSFKINSSDPEIARKKAFQEGRIYQVRKELKTFEECKKGEEE
jgi:hypothetical protein